MWLVFVIWVNSYANEREDHLNHWETTQSFDSALELSWVRSLGREDPLEKEMATHSNTVAWRIPWREEPGSLQSMGSPRVRHD